jgi:hypothetical protein
MNHKSLTVSVAPQLQARLREELVRDTIYVFHTTISCTQKKKNKHQLVVSKVCNFCDLYIRSGLNVHNMNAEQKVRNVC